MGTIPGRSEAVFLDKLTLNQKPTSLSSRPQLKVLHYKRIDSTNSRAFKLAEEGAPEWTVVVSDVQTRGHGRSGKSWSSPQGGLWFSVILRPKIPSTRIGIIQIIAANAVVDAVRNVSRVRVGVKWPNDIVVRSKKLCGILVESKLIGSDFAFAIVGIGLNVNQSRKTVPSGAISLFMTTGKKYNLEHILRKVLSALQSRYALTENIATVRDEWWGNCAHRFKRVRVERADETLEGRSVGIDENGRLLLETSLGRTEEMEEGTLQILARS